MAESKKGDASNAETSARSSDSGFKRTELLEADDFGKDFLNSWKSISIPEDDGLDFNKETVSKGKKNSFNFDKLDMDFSLDGDFDKKMSFNVDMSDLDFSSPPKKPSKSKEKSTEEYPRGKQGGKKNSFAFDFNFNELDSFDFDSSLPKEKLKSDKAADLKETPGKQEKVQTASNKPAASIDLPEDNFDLDSTLLKGKNKSGKAADLKGFDSPEKQAVVQTTKSLPNTGLDLPEDSLDSNLVKAKKSDKATDLHGSKSPVKQNNVQTVKNIASVDLPEDRGTDRVPTSEHQETTKSEHMVGGKGEVRYTYDSPSTSANVGISSPTHSTAASPEKETSMEVNDDQCSQQSEMIGSSELKAENVHRDLSVPTTSMEGSLQEAGSDAHGEYSMAIDAKNNSEKALDFSVQLANLEDSPRIPSAEPNSSKNEHDVVSGSQSDVGTEDTSINEMNKGNTDSNISSVRNLSQKTLQCTRPAKENNEKLKRLPQLTSEPTVHQPIKEKGQCGIQSRYFNKSFRTESQLDTQLIPKKTGLVSNIQSDARLSPVVSKSEPSAQQPIKEKGNSRIQSKYFNKSAETELRPNSQLVPKESCLVNSDRKTENMPLNLEDSKRQECTSSNDAHARIQKVNNSKSCEPAERKGIVLGNGKNDETQKTSPGFQVHSSNLPGQTVKSANPKSLNSKLAASITAIRNSKSSDSEGKKVSHIHAAKETLKPSSLKVLRFESPKAALPSKPLTVMKSLRSLEKSPANPCKSVKFDHTVTVDLTGQQSPLMKRKMNEDPDVSPENLHPSKRVTASPKECRMSMETSERSNATQVCQTKNLMDSFRSSSIVDVSRDVSPTQLEVSLVVENNENVKKAEAYGKELDEMCNMLRKKHEEAKELLACSVVNNNKLLMLYHPSYGEKISVLQQFASEAAQQFARLAL